MARTISAVVDRRAGRGRAAFRRSGLAVLLVSMLAVPAMGQDKRSLAGRFTLAASAETIPALVTSDARSLFPAGANIPPVSGDKTAGPQRPAVRAGKVTAQILGGAAVTGAMFGLAFLTASESTLDDDEAMRGRGAAFQLVGGAVLTPLVVYLIGNTGPQTGSLGRTCLYGAAGGAAGALVLFLAFESDSDALGIFALAVSTLVPAAASVIGYNSSRRYDEPAPVRTALLGLEGGKLRFGIPAPAPFISGGAKRSLGIALRIFEAKL